LYLIHQSIFEKYFLEVFTGRAAEKEEIKDLFNIKWKTVWNDRQCRIIIFIYSNWEKYSDNKKTRTI